MKALIGIGLVTLLFILLPKPAMACAGKIVCGYQSEFACEGSQEGSYCVANTADCAAKCSSGASQQQEPASPVSPTEGIPTSSTTNTSPPQTSSSTDGVSSPALENSYQKSKLFEKALIPTLPSPTPLPEQEEDAANKIGVKKDLFADLKELVFCRIFNYCPRSFALGQKQLDDFEKTAQILNKSQQPAQSLGKPAKRDERVNDTDTDDLANKTTGNLRLNSIDASLAGQTGYLTSDAPKFVQYDPNKSDLPDNVINKKRERFNINYKGIVLQDDDRTPNLKAQEEMFCNSSIPKQAQPANCQQ